MEVEGNLFYRWIKKAIGNLAKPTHDYKVWLLDTDGSKGKIKLGVGLRSVQGPDYKYLLKIVSILEDNKLLFEKEFSLTYSDSGKSSKKAENMESYVNYVRYMHTYQHTTIEKEMAQQDPTFSFDSPISYVPMVNGKRTTIWENPNDPFKITENGKPVSGIYVPIFYHNSFDGGWRVFRDPASIKIREYDVNDGVGIGTKRNLKIELTSELISSGEFHGTYPLIVPVNSFPSREFVEELRDQEHEIYIDDIGRFFSTKECKSVSVDYYSGGVKRLDNLEKHLYREFPEDYRINLHLEQWTGDVPIRGGELQIIFTPTYLRKDETSLERLKNRDIVPTGFRYDRDEDTGDSWIFKNVILDNLNKKYLSEQLSATKFHYSYPHNDELKRIAERQYFEEAGYYYTNKEQGLSLLEFLNVMLVADCDVANIDFMIRMREKGWATRLGIGYMTINGMAGGQSIGELHGWAETLITEGGVETWKITDATPSGSINSNKPLEYSYNIRVLTPTIDFSNPVDIEIRKVR